VTKQLLNSELGKLRDQARAAPRRRAHQNFHASFDESVQRSLMAMEPDSYVRAHRHAEADRWEFVLVLSGAVVLLVFDSAGVVIERVELTAGGETLGYELAPGEWHTLFALLPGTVVFEFKPGPYHPLTDKEFAAWAPAEGDAQCAEMLAWYRCAQTGERRT